MHEFMLDLLVNDMVLAFGSFKKKFCNIEIDFPSVFKCLLVTGGLQRNVRCLFVFILFSKYMNDFYACLFLQYKFRTRVIRKGRV